jgi:hypothetical protein
MISGITISDVSKEMYKRTKKQIKNFGKKLPKNFSHIYDGAKKPNSFLPPSDFEAKRVNRFLLTIPKKSIGEWMVRNVTRPSYPFNNELKVTLIDSLNPSNTKELLDLIKNNQEFDIKFKMCLKMLDPTGVIVEKWVFKKCLISKVEWSILDYSSDNISEIYLTIIFEELKIKI